MIYEKLSQKASVLLISLTPKKNKSMKKYLLSVMLVMVGLYSNSQDLKNVTNMILLKQFDKAKVELDTYMNDPKNAAKADAWYYKAFVYNSLGRMEAKPAAERKNLLLESFNAIKKYMELDAKATLTKEEENSTVFNIYYSFFDLGANAYNGKDFPESYALFTKSLEIHDYIFNKNIIGPKGMKFSMHDTDVVWNLAFLANDLKKKEETLVYYKKIADADLNNQKYIGAYDELVLKYKKENNSELFTKYITAAKKHYPADKAYWENLEIDFALNGLENEALFKKYDELTASHPDSYMLFYNYGVELNKFINAPEAKGKDIAALKKKMVELFTKAISINSSIEANLQLTNYYYNSSFDIQDEALKIKGTKPDEVKKKNELLALRKSTLQQAVPYGEEAIKQLAVLKTYKYSDKVNYKLALEILSHAYKQGGNAAKAAEYDKKKDEIDKL